MSCDTPQPEVPPPPPDAAQGPPALDMALYRDAPVLASLADAMNAGLGQRAHVVCRVTNLYAPEAADGQIRHRVELRGQSSRDVRPADSVAFTDPRLRAMAEWAHVNGVLVVASGAFVSDGKPRGRGGAPVHFRIDALKPLERVLPLLSATVPEIETTAALYQRLAAIPNGIYDYLAQTFFRSNDIAAESLSVRQHRALRLIALQALSCGMLPAKNHNPRLSVLLTSSPGRSKKVMVEFAAALTPSFAWVHPTETTPAGLFAFLSNRRMLQGLMAAKLEPLTLRFPRSAVAELPALSEELNQHLHGLLERNTEGTLSVLEQRELETLVRMAAQFAQLLALAVERTDQP